MKLGFNYLIIFNYSQSKDFSLEAKFLSKNPIQLFQEQPMYMQITIDIGCFLNYLLNFIFFLQKLIYWYLYFGQV